MIQIKEFILHLDLYDMSSSSSSSSFLLDSVQYGKGYFCVEASPSDRRYLYGTRQSVYLYIERRDLPLDTIVTAISVGVLDGVGVTMQEAGNYVHGVIESVLHSSISTPPLGAREYIPPLGSSPMTDEDKCREQNTRKPRGLI